MVCRRPKAASVTLVPTRPHPPRRVPDSLCSLQVARCHSEAPGLKRPAFSAPPPQPRMPLGPGLWHDGRPQLALMAAVPHPRRDADRAQRHHQRIAVSLRLGRGEAEFLLEERERRGAVRVLQHLRHRDGAVQVLGERRRGWGSHGKSMGDAKGSFRALRRKDYL